MTTTRFRDESGREIELGTVTVDKIIAEFEDWIYVRATLPVDLGSGFDFREIAFCVGVPPWGNRVEAWFAHFSDHWSTGLDSEGVRHLEDHLLDQVNRLFDEARALLEVDP